jgi:hypothetical protein
MNLLCEGLIVSERRESLRSSTNRAAVISLGNGDQIDCRVRDVSPCGARLETLDQRRLPETFSLMVVGDWKMRPCRLAWRKDQMLGVEYL